VSQRDRLCKYTTTFSSRSIPESYILLRDVPTIPFKTLYTDPAQVAHMVSLNRPVLLAQNDCILTVVSSVLNAFDRLEVAEYSARSLIDAVAIGQYVPIGDDEIRDLESAFSLSPS
jgi:L-fuculose-phosphate aldolase